jgi:hypothetical protein
MMALIMFQLSFRPTYLQVTLYILKYDNVRSLTAMNIGMLFRINSLLLSSIEKSNLKRNESTREMIIIKTSNKIKNRILFK